MESVVERTGAHGQTIAHIKNGRIMTTQYRGHLDRINNVILAAIGLQALNGCLSGRTLSFSRLTRLTLPGVSE